MKEKFTKFNFINCNLFKMYVIQNKFKMLNSISPYEKLNCIHLNFEILSK